MQYFPMFVMKPSPPTYTMQYKSKLICVCELLLSSHNYFKPNSFQINS